MARVELPPVSRKRVGRIATGLVGVLLIGGCTENGGKNEPPPPSPSVTTPGESTNPFITPSLSPISSSLCDTQVGTQEGQLAGGKPLLSASALRPSIFVVSPDRSGQQSLKVASELNPGEWQTIEHKSSVGIVGIATADTIFDTTQGRAVWARTCEPTPAAGVDEVASRAKDLCKRPDMGITEVVIYHVGQDGKPQLQGAKSC